jgi:hypothetical protein
VKIGCSKGGKSLTRVGTGGNLGNEEMLERTKILTFWQPDESGNTVVGMFDGGSFRMNQTWLRAFSNL